MTPQVGDRYSCSECGCEIEVTKSSSSSPIGARTQGDISSGTTRTSDLGRTSGSVGEQSPGDYAAQGTTGEGVFGTAGTSHSASAKGRYGSNAPSSSRSASSDRSDTASSASAAPSCFCGHAMQLSGQGRSSAARAR